MKKYLVLFCLLTCKCYGQFDYNDLEPLTYSSNHFLRYNSNLQTQLIPLVQSFRNNYNTVTYYQEANQACHTAELHFKYAYSNDSVVYIERLCDFQELLYKEFSIECYTDDFYRYQAWCQQQNAEVTAHRMTKSIDGSDIFSTFTYSSNFIDYKNLITNVMNNEPFGYPVIANQPTQYRMAFYKSIDYSDYPEAFY